MARAWHLKSRPSGMPTADNFELKEVALPPLGDGMVRVRNLWLSVDPYMRGRMNDVKSYVPPFQVGEPMEGGAVGEVVESKAEGFAPGDLVQHMAGWRDEAVIPARTAQQAARASARRRERFLGVLGVTGATAYFGLLDAAQREGRRHRLRLRGGRRGRLGRRPDRQGQGHDRDRLGRRRRRNASSSARSAPTRSSTTRRARSSRAWPRPRPTASTSISTMSAATISTPPSRWRATMPASRSAG